MLNLIGSDGENYAIYTGSDTIIPGNWYRIAIVFEKDAPLPLIFINGEQMMTWYYLDRIRRFPGFNHPTSGDVFIGEREEGDRAFQGTIDWIRIWNKACDLEKVKKFDLFVPPEEREGLIAWFQFNEGAGIHAADALNLSGVGVMSGARWVPKDLDLLPIALNP